MELVSKIPRTYTIKEINKLEKKWRKCSNLPAPSPDSMQFLVDTRILFSIDSYKNTFLDSSAQHAIRLGADNVHQIKVEEEFLPIKEVMAKVFFDPMRGKIVSKNNSEEIWSYGAQGLWKHDRFRYDEQMPVSLSLTATQYEGLLKQGKSFWGEDNPHASSHACILQVITTQHQEPRRSLEKNWARGRPQHVTIRLIDEQGDVYSFGFERETHVAADVRSKGSYWQTFFTSSRVHAASPDYEEFYPSWNKLATPISVSVNTFEAIRTFVEAKNKEGISFNFLGGDMENHANCMTFAREILRMAGVQEGALPRRTSIYDYLFSLLPDLGHIPYAGYSLAQVAKLVSSVALHAFSLCIYFIPESLASGISKGAKAIFFFPRRVTWLAANAAIAYGGGTKMGLEAKRPLIGSLHDLFKEPLSDSHVNLIRWQEQQRSTRKIDSSACVKFHGLDFQATA